MSRLRLVVITAITIVAITVPVSSSAADWLAAPFVGATFGGRTPSGSLLDGGGSFAWMPGGMFGVEVDGGHTTDFFRVPQVTDPLFARSSTSSLMFNAVVMPPHAWSLKGLRPFGVVGLGPMWSRIGRQDDFVRVRNTHVGMTVGGGAVLFFTSRFGVRGDLRYLRDLQQLQSDSEFFSLGERHLDFWRSTAGFVIRF